MDYTLSATNITDSGFTITITTDVSTTTKTLELSVSDRGASIYLESVTDPGMPQGSYILERQIPNLNGSTEYIVTFQLGGMDMANPITVTTKPTGYDTPKTATQEQWENLADRVNVRPIIGTVVSQPTAVAYVDTANIVNDAVTPAKLDMASLIDIFYPVGCYFETSDTTFDPNVSWGGTWVEDSTGKVTVSQDSGTFDTVGDTGGIENTHHVVYCPPINSSKFQDPGMNYLNAAVPRMEIWLQSGGSTTLTRSMAIIGAGGDMRSNGTSNTEVSHYTYSSTNLQPYVVVKRWHRTA